MKLHLLARLGRFRVFALFRRPAPTPPPQQLALDLDQLTTTGLPLREALPIRSAEYWLQLGAPELALRELQTLPETARRHDWSLRVQRAALHATHSLPV